MQEELEEQRRVAAIKFALKCLCNGQKVDAIELVDSAKIIENYLSGKIYK
jgi:hypothetical protein